MNCLSLNIRGIGVEEKVRWARKLKLLHKATFIGIQETQLNDYTDINVNGCWDSSDYDFEGVNATGRSGGLLSIWNTNCFQKSKVLKSRYYLIIIGKWIGVTGNTIFANIYGPQAPVDKRLLWQELIELK